MIHKPEACCFHFYLYGYHNITYFSDPLPSTLSEQVTPSKMVFMAGVYYDSDFLTFGFIFICVIFACGE